MDDEDRRWIEEPPRPPVVYGRAPIHGAAWPSRMGDAKLLYLLTLACVRGYDVRIVIDVIEGVAGVFTGRVERVSVHDDHGDLIWCKGEWQMKRYPRYDDGALRDGPFNANLHVAYITEIELLGLSEKVLDPGARVSDNADSGPTLTKE